MTQNEILIYDVIIAVMGDLGVTNINGMPDSDKTNWENLMKVLRYKVIIRLHLKHKTPDEIVGITASSFHNYSTPYI